MVVSAMGKNTDVLIDLAREITDQPPAREMDMLLSTGEQVSVALMAMAIHSLGHKAISLTGAQIGIKTDSTHTKARIQSISTDRMRRALDEGKIVIAAGFQGIDEDFNITTLGRGGSDTTAVALAAVLRADACEIYTDVDGVYTTDPRMLPEARRVQADQLRRDARAGQPGRRRDAQPLDRVRQEVLGADPRAHQLFSDVPGTMIVAEPEAPDQPVGGAALVKNEARVTIVGVPDRPGASLAIFSKIAAKNDRGRHDRAERRGRREGRHLVHRRSRRTARDARSGRKRPPTSWAPRRVSTTTTCRRFRSSAWAWPGRRAWPGGCSAPWPTPA